MTKDEIELLLHDVKNLCGDLELLEPFLPHEIYGRLYKDIRKLCKDVETQLKDKT